MFRYIPSFEVDLLIIWFVTWFSILCFTLYLIFHNFFSIMSRTCTFTPQVVTGFSRAHDRSVIFSYLVLISDSPLYQNACKLRLRPLATSPSRQMSTQPWPSPLPKFPLSGVALMRLVAQCEMRNKKGKRRCCQGYYYNVLYVFHPFFFSQCY